MQAWPSIVRNFAGGNRDGLCLTVCSIRLHCLCLVQNSVYCKLGSPRGSDDTRVRVLRGGSRPHMPNIAELPLRRGLSEIARGVKFKSPLKAPTVEHLFKRRSRCVPDREQSWRRTSSLPALGNAYSPRRSEASKLYNLNTNMTPGIFQGIGLGVTITNVTLHVLSGFVKWKIKVDWLN